MTANDLAESKGYERAKFEKQWKGFRVYEAVPKEFAITGYPFFILEKDNELRFANIDEVLEYMFG